jgi:hypothetical protein
VHRPSDPPPRRQVLSETRIGLQTCSTSLSENGSSESGTGESGDGDGESGDGDGDGESGDGDGDGESGDGDGESGDGDGESGDGDGDPVLLDPCTWVPAAASECDIAFTPVPPEPPPPAMTYMGITTLDIVAHVDTVEVLWVREYANNEGVVEVRRYLASNAQGAWQHQFLHSAPCDFFGCLPQGPPRIGGSEDRTQITPPYIRREGGQWQAPIIDAQTDPLAWNTYNDPVYFAVGPDDRSYFVESHATQTGIEWGVWAETNLGCHVPTWGLEITDCRPIIVGATAVDAAGFLHATGLEEASEDDWRLVHWFFGPDSVERTELASIPLGTYQSLAIGDSNEIHLCHWATSSGVVATYAHGHDANDWTSIEIEDPDVDEINAISPGYCQLALAPDGTAWLAWQAGELGPMKPFRVASVADDIITYEIVDVGVLEGGASLTVDPLGRPWLAYRPPPPGVFNTFKVAHKDGGQWTIEQIVTP